MKLIDKDAVVAEIENIKSIEFNEETSSDTYACMALDMVKEVVDTLEVKEINSNNTFIDKACDFLKSYRQDTPDGTGYIAGIIDDKTIEDFKKCMKGE